MTVTVGELVDALQRRPPNAVAVCVVEEMIEHERDGRPVVALELVLAELEDVMFRVRWAGRVSDPVNKATAYLMADAYTDGGRLRRVAHIQYRYPDGWRDWDTVDCRTAWGRFRARSVLEAVRAGREPSDRKE